MTTAKGFTPDAVREMLRKKIGDQTQKDFAAQIGIKPAYLCDILKGNRAPGSAVLTCLGLEPGYIVKQQRAA